MSLKVFWKRNLGFFKLAITTNLEYRVNFITDAVIQPSMTVVIELLLWLAVFRSSQSSTIAGLGIDYYLAYALWGAFFARIAASWMYEFRMVDEIESGTVNTLLTRPVSFYEYYFSQLMGYKFITMTTSLLIPLMASLILPWPVQLERLPLATTLVVFYLVLVHSISFVVSCCAFFLNRIHSFTVAKNLLLWTLTGEIIPLDLMPEPFHSLLVSLPFSAGVFVPVGYLTGRLQIQTVAQSFLSVTVGLIFVNLLGAWLWRRGLRAYVGTGA